MSRTSVAVAFVAVIAAIAPADGYAHQGNADYRSELDGVTPPVEGLEAEVVNYDDALELRNETGETVIVEGYAGEPYIRIDGDGQVFLNTRSPAYYLNDDRYGEAEVPASADPDAKPEWEAVDGTGRYSWHDHRIHYMSTGTPSQVADEDARTKIFDYRVPIEVGDRGAEITGTLYWAGGSGGLPLAPFIALGVLALLAAAVVVVRRRRGSGPEPGEVPEAW